LAITIHKLLSSFSAELYAILYAVPVLFASKFHNTLIITESLSDLQAMSTGTWKKHTFVNKIHLLNSNLTTVRYETLTIERNPFPDKNQTLKDLTEYIFRLQSRHYQLLFK